MPEPVNWEANLRTLLKQIGTPAICWLQGQDGKVCGQPIFWLTTKNGRQAPYTEIGISHFADCPYAGRSRKSKEPTP